MKKGSLLLDLVGVLAGGATAEVSLGALEVVVGALPVRTLPRVARGRAESLARVGDGVVEAVGRDARGGLLPGAPSARLVGESAQRICEEAGWLFERDAQVFAAAA
jgi:hypothetical protein